MSQIKEEIERWLKNHPHTPFTLIGVDESGGYDFKLEPDVLLWKLYVDDETGKPVVRPLLPSHNQVFECIFLPTIIG
jgi:hypothetical protein